MTFTVSFFASKNGAIFAAEKEVSKIPVARKYLMNQYIILKLQNIICPITLPIQSFVCGTIKY